MLKQIASNIAEIFKTGEPRRRKQDATVMIAELKGFEQVPELVGSHEIIYRAQETVAQISRVAMFYDCTVSLVSMSGLMVSFGAPRELSDHQSNAALCAIEIQWAVQQENLKRQIQGMVALDVSLSLASGPVYTGNLEGLAAQHCAVIGEPVRMADRISRFTPPSQIFAHESTIKKLGSKVEFHPVHLQGVPEYMEHEKIFRILLPNPSLKVSR